MKPRHKNRLLALGLTGVLAASVLGAGAALAQEGGSGSPSAAESGPARGRPAVRVGLGAIVEASGLDRPVFAEGFKAGKSINDILAGNGLDPAAVQAAALDLINQKLDEAVANGRITQEQADTAAARAAERLPGLMARVPDGTGRPGAILRLAKGFLQGAAQSIGIEPRALVSQLRDGKTVAQVATEQGVDPATVVANLTAAANGRIDEAVANGTLTPEQGQSAKERAAAAIERFVNEGRPARPGRGPGSR